MVSADDFELGALLLRVAKREGVPVRAAFWLLDGTRDRWQLVLESGAAEGNVRDLAIQLLKAADRLPEEQDRRNATDLLLSRTTVHRAHHPVAEALRAAMPGAQVEGAKLRGTRVGGTIIEGALLYQLEAEQRSKKKRAPRAATRSKTPHHRHTGR